MRAIARRWYPVRTLVPNEWKTAGNPRNRRLSDARVRWRPYGSGGPGRVLAFCGLIMVAGAACRGRGPARAPAADGLGELRPQWRVQGLRATHSLLTTSPSGSLLPALKPIDARHQDLCVVDVRRGLVTWCSPLDPSSIPVLSVAGKLVIAQDFHGVMTAYDLDTGRRAWATQPDCMLTEAGVRDLGSKIALARCRPRHPAGADDAVESTEKLIALDPATGRLAWKISQVASYGDVFLDGTTLIAPAPPPDLSFMLRPLGAIVRRPPKRKPQALLGAAESPWRLFDLATGLPRPPADLAPTHRRATGTSSAAAVGESFALESVFSRSAEFFTQAPDGATQKPTRSDGTCSRFGGGCIPTPLHEFHRARRGGRLFEFDCDTFSEVESTTGLTLRTWSIAGKRRFTEPAVVALDVDGPRITLVLASYDDHERGRVVTYDDKGGSIVARAPQIDPNLVGLMAGVLVTQERVTAGPTAAPEVALVGYAVTDALDQGGPFEDADRARVREVVRDRGGFTQYQCEQWDVHFDPLASARLRLIPRWEEHLLALMWDRELRVQEAAFAAAFYEHTPTLLQGMMDLVASGREPITSSERPENDWTSTVRERHDWARGSAAMVLMKARYAPALPGLTKAILEEPPLLMDRPAHCSSFVRALCAWVAGSPLPEAKAAIEMYDRAMDAPGAWRARCSVRDD